MLYIASSLFVFWCSIYDKIYALLNAIYEGVNEFMTDLTDIFDN